MPASYADVLAAPEHMVAELLAGELHLQPRPALPHAMAASALGEEPPFKRGKGGPGGWLIVDEPEVHLGPDVLVPDLAGWRRTTLDEVGNVAFLETCPDWVCEVLSPGTERTDRAVKLPIYAREGSPRVARQPAAAHPRDPSPRRRALDVCGYIRGRPADPRRAV